MRGDQPDKIDRYEILEAIGFGAMGAVYKAFDPIIKRPVAVKTLRLDVPPGSPDYRAFLERFSTEARTAGRLSHPNIVTLYDVGHTEDQVPWLAMEFVQGQTVADILETERLKPELVIGLVSQIASAVDYAHREGVVHRDIKPSNVMVHGGEKVKVTDFGIASFMDAERTNSGLMMGTPSYMSPEQAMGEDLDGRTDIFSLGVVAFEMLSGKQPFPGNNVTSILYKLVHADPIQPDDLEVIGLLPNRWHDVFARVLAKDPRERHPSAAEFVRDLELCLGSWFGALDGGTVIVDRRETIGPGTESDPDSDPDQTIVSPPPHEEDDVTVQMMLDSSREPPTQELDAPRGLDADETVLVPPPVTDEALYAGPSKLGTAPSPTAPAAVSTATIRRRSARTKWVLAASGLAASVLLVLALVVSGGGEANGPDGGGDEVEPPPPEIVVDSGVLSVYTEPDGATVAIDGEELGQTPLELPAFPLGDYTVEVQLDGFETEDVAALLTAAAPQATFDLTLTRVAPPPPKPAYLRVESVPPGADVEVDGTGQGQTPSSAMVVRPGTRVVRVLMDGYLPWEDSVVARAGSTETVTAELTLRGGALAGETEDTEPEPPPPPPPRIAEGTLVERDDPGVTRPRCLECPAVPYPEAARRSRLQGVVLLGFIIDETGRVVDPVVQESGGDVFDSAVIEVVRGWRYEPASKEGVRVKVRWIQRFRFEQGR